MPATIELLSLNDINCHEEIEAKDPAFTVEGILLARPTSRYKEGQLPRMECGGSSKGQSLAA